MVDIHDPNCDVLKIFEEFWEHIYFRTWFERDSLEIFLNNNCKNFPELDEDIKILIKVWISSEILIPYQNYQNMYRVNYYRLKELGVTWPGLNSDTLEQAARVRMTS
jgi:hypothetical protein